MAQQRIFHPEWRDEQESVKYPFADSAMLRNAAGDFVPETVFLDAAFYVIGGGSRLHLSRIEISREQVVLTVGDENHDALATGAFALLDPPEIIRFLDLYGRPAGLLVSEPDRLAIFQAWSVGTHTFRPEDTEFAAACCMPSPEIGFRGFVLASGDVFAGDVWLVGEDGVVFDVRLETVEGLAGPVLAAILRVDVIGDILFRRKLCEGTFSTPRFLQTITYLDGQSEVVCAPNDRGQVRLSVGSQDALDTVLRIRPVGETLVFEAVGERMEVTA